ncbi:minichromosome maintenance-related protein [Porites harrisoni]
MADQDDLDILASLADSDFEFQDDDYLGEAISSSNASPKSTASVSSSKSQQHQKQGHGGDQVHVKSITTPHSSVEEMAAQIAALQEQVRFLQSSQASQQQTSGNDQKGPDFPKESNLPDDTQARGSHNSNKQTSPSALFSKDKKRVAHTPAQSRNQPVSIESGSKSLHSVKQKSAEYLSTAQRKGSFKTTESKAADSLDQKGKRLSNRSLGSSNNTVAKQLETRTRTSTNDDNNYLSEKFSGLRIVNPLISSVVMEKRMEGRKMVKISQIPTKIKGNNDIDGDWVTIGVLVQKLPPKTSSNGKTYGIWKLSDLGANTTNEFVALFLFGDVYKEHWKTTEGSVVALLNASILPAKEKNSHDLALTLDNAKKLMMMGISKDLGKCKDVRRSDNRSCGNFVNRQHGEFCEYHIQAAYKKMQSQRMECQAGYAPSAKAPLMKKFQKDLNNSTFMYQGRTVTASNHTTDHKKKNVTLKSLGIGNKSVAELNAKTDSSDKLANKNTAEPSEYLVQLLNMPTAGSRNLVKHLNQDEEQKKPEEEKQPLMSASDLLKAHESDLKRNKMPPSTTSTVTSTPNNKQDTPFLGRGLARGSDIFFDESPNVRKRKSSDFDKAKSRALSLVKLKGPIEKEDPNAVRKRLSPKALEQIEKRACEDSGKENDEENGSEDSRTKRRRILGPEFGSIDLNSEEGKKLLAAKSRHVGAVLEAENEREEKYFNELEKKEQLEDKMKTITEIKVNVVSCKQCNYVAESASQRCYKENHTLKHFKTLKKFFACKECKQRTIAYGKPLPKDPCKNCGASNYQKTSMYKEKEGPKIGGETLLVRGVGASKIPKQF